MLQIYRTAMSKCDFSMQPYWNHTSEWSFSSKFTAYIQDTFSKEYLWVAASENWFLTKNVRACMKDVSSDETIFDHDFWQIYAQQKIEIWERNSTKDQKQPTEVSFKQSYS